MAFAEVRWAEIDTLFLDAGGTLISMDFERIARELALLGAPCSAVALSRAEAAVRPLVSRMIQSGGSTEGRDTFSFFIERVLERVLSLDTAAWTALVDRLVPRIRVPGRSRKRCGVVLPGGAAALRRRQAT